MPVKGDFALQQFYDKKSCEPMSVDARSSLIVLTLTGGKIIIMRGYGVKWSGWGGGVEPRQWKGRNMVVIDGEGDVNVTVIV